MENISHTGENYSTHPIDDEDPEIDYEKLVAEMNSDVVGYMFSNEKPHVQDQFFLTTNGDHIILGFGSNVLWVSAEEEDEASADDLKAVLIDRLKDRVKMTKLVIKALW